MFSTLYLSFSISLCFSLLIAFTFVWSSISPPKMSKSLALIISMSSSYSFFSFAKSFSKAVAFVFVFLLLPLPFVFFARGSMTFYFEYTVLYPMESLISNFNIWLSSTAYSIGNSLVNGSKKPMTIISVACDFVKPRLIK